MPEFRLYGDNIVECERGLELLSDALGANRALVDSALYAPQYQLMRARESLGVFELVPGYDRWPVDLKEYLRQRGSPLREATDVLLTRGGEGAGKPRFETPLFAVEFCGALPAGNNAWQRSGRALACAYAGIPYLYFAEIGGLELAGDRTARAARLPNPVVPFAYLTMGEALSCVAAPVFAHSPSTPPDLNDKFVQCFGEADALQLVRNLLEGSSDVTALARLRARALTLTKMLADMRRRSDTIKNGEWDALAGAKVKASWFTKRQMRWRKTVSIPVNATFRSLLAVVVQLGGCAVGSEEIPCCVLPADVRSDFAERCAKIYKGRVNQRFLDWVGRPGPLVCVWVAGFKPRGDDSRPDRGLVPLARMLVGENSDLLTVVYGPASRDTWERFATDPHVLAATNGLWEALLGLSDALLIDSPTAPQALPVGHLVTRPGKERRELPLHSVEVMTPTTFGEHDVDTVLHILFGTGIKPGVFEGLCNPPGGDWSGISYFDYNTLREFRWTSLPRVSGSGRKRPDHLVQFSELGGDGEMLLAIESKETGRRVESGVGPRLSQYIQSLMETPPNVLRNKADQGWTSNGDRLPKRRREVLTAAAFLYDSPRGLSAVRERAETDVAIGLQFEASKGKVLLHVLEPGGRSSLAKELVELVQPLRGRLEVQVH